MTRWLDADPWMVPVPVAPSRYLALDPAHQPWNVETAPGRVAPFSWDLDALDDTELLHADLQLHPDDNAPGRLGAGRAGRHRGRVVKGVGRTALAANWNRADDRFHGNGWLSASSALRERFIKMKNEGTLTPAAVAADKVVNYLLSDAFGTTPTADVRELS